MSKALQIVLATGLVCVSAPEEQIVEIIMEEEELFCRNYAEVIGVWDWEIEEQLLLEALENAKNIQDQDHGNE